jgi:hypothetical protein
MCFLRVVSIRKDLLFQDYKQEDVNYYAICDFLRYGMLVGDETF